jgi:kynurenine aminotransferase
MPGGTVRYVPMRPPTDGAERTSSAANWKIDMDVLKKTINSNTRMIVSVYSFLRLILAHR